MTKYRETPRIHSLGFSQQNIAYSSNVSKKTVNRVINRAKELKMYRKQRDMPKHGKQTLKQLMRHGTGVSNIEITDANIKAFSQTAKKYGIDFALKKADDRYLVFFKGLDADVLTAAFRESYRGLSAAAG